MTEPTVPRTNAELMQLLRDAMEIVHNESQSDRALVGLTAVVGSLGAS